jgi:hypothetical protein
MLPSLSRGLALALALAASLGHVAWNSSSAYAQDDDEDDEGDDEGDGGDEGGEEEEDDDKEQPAVTAGGLFTLKTFPIRELDRPLTITQNIAQVRAGFGTDVSAQGAFESVGLSLEGLYGYRDNFMLLGGFTSAYNFKQFGIYAGFEGALAYDLIDFRMAARISRPAAPGFDVVDGMNVPNGEYAAGDVKGSIDLGFPFRYVARPEIAIIALNTLMSIDFDSKPDLNPSLGISTNPIPPVSIVIFAQLQIIDFNTDAENFTIPATARIQFSPNRKLDIGGEFTFLNMKPPEGQKFYDNRFLTLFLASRFGR